MVPVAPESQQGKSPGSGAGNRQSDVGLGTQAGRMQASDAGSRGGPGSQTGGRSGASWPGQDAGQGIFAANKIACN